MKFTKYFIMVTLVLILTSCSLINETEKQKVIDYLSKSEDYKEYKDEYDRVFYVLNIEGDVNSDFAYYYNNDIDYAYYSIYEDNFEYVRCRKRGFSPIQLAVGKIFCLKFARFLKKSYCNSWKDVLQCTAYRDMPE